MTDDGRPFLLINDAEVDPRNLIFGTLESVELAGRASHFHSDGTFKKASALFTSSTWSMGFFLETYFHSFLVFYLTKKKPLIAASSITSELCAQSSCLHTG